MDKNKSVNREEGYHLSSRWKKLQQKTVTVNGAEVSRLNAPRAYIREISDHGESISISRRNCQYQQRNIKKIFCPIAKAGRSN